ncbi:MAG TPA: LysM peptidoglycan-binding domain-containing protein [Tepidisphaeraceae bacterium]|jgi:phage tail protein X
MTRETKIGLLVGLAFIIVIGILLSDHLTSSTEPPPATLAQTGSNVRQQVAVPGGGTQATLTPPVTPPQIQPQMPVPTAREIQPQTPASAIVQVGGPTQAQQQMPQTMQQPAMPSPTAYGQQQQQPPITVVGNTHQQQQVQMQQQEPIQVAGADAPDRNVPGGLAQVAQQHGEPLVTATPGQPQQVIQGTGNNSQSMGSPQLAGYKDYVVQPGDSVSRLATKFFGSNTKANRDAIVRANAALQADPNKLIVGKTYRIPTVVQTQQTASPMTSTQAPPPQAQMQQTIIRPAPQAQAPQPATPTEYWYTVKEGDTLTRILREQLGQDESAIPALVELNRDTIANPDNLRVNMKIKLPAKPLAQAN